MQTCTHVENAAVHDVLALLSPEAWLSDFTLLLILEQASRILRDSVVKH